MNQTYYTRPIAGVDCHGWWRWDGDEWQLHYSVNIHDDGRCFDDPYGFELKAGMYLPVIAPPKPGKDSA